MVRGESASKRTSLPPGLLHASGRGHPRWRHKATSARLLNISEGEKDEFPKGGRHKRPYTLHRTALLWPNRDEGWGRAI
jgi:hypothetical protein